ncbi:MAG: UDP-glucose 4-epimerase GalE [Pseudomonadota bacterium]|nr:UDP-glucose 4-epimerase GalE [Pseudomonadota bacterium]
MILITGGLGYIGSHMTAALMAQGHEVIVVDNLSNARMDMLERLEYLAGRYVTFVRVDIRNTPALQKVFEQYAITAVVHCAGLKVAADSPMQPLDYYNANVGGLMSLLRVMQRTGVRHLIYGSTALVYGDQPSPLSEQLPAAPQTPYANSCKFCEDMLHDLALAETDWRIAVLRYFNVAGAHPTGVIGEWPNGISSNLMPFLAQAARGERESVEVLGDDYETVDGSAVRDYVHVMDVIDVQMQAFHWLFSQPHAFGVFNIGRGEGVSVKQMIAQFAALTERPIEMEVLPRRAGDVPELVANIEQARTVLQWQPSRSLDDIIQDTWKFYQSLNA